MRVTCVEIGPTRIIGGPPGLVGGKRVITAPWNTGGSGGGSDDGSNDGSTYLSDLIVNCLSEGSTDIESIKDKLKNIFAKCPQVNSNMIESMASRMNRVGSQNWSSLLAGFIKSYLICPECLENVYSENCLGSKNTRSSKLEEISIKYNSF